MSTKLNFIVFLFFFLTIGNSISYSQNKTKKDSVKLNVKSLIKPTDTIKKDSIKKNKSPLEGIVNRKAKDYEKLEQKKKRLTLYNEAELKYQEFELKSGIIVLDYDKNEVYAGRLKDSLGKYVQAPNFKQGENVIDADSIRYNIKTGKVKVWNTFTKQGEMVIHSETSKRENDSVVFFERAKLTTSVNKEDPEYYFLAYKSKLVPGKKFVTGPVNMYIANVPTPIGLPFAFFPMNNKNTSGVLIPTPGQSNTQGYFLQNGGYYFALSDYYDLAITGDYFTNGSYALRQETSYAKKYKFSGSLSSSFVNGINSEKGLPDYSVSKAYNVQWSHSQDAKASTNSRFSASVNFGSSQFFRNALSVSNTINVGSALVNTQASSISYTKTFPKTPAVNLSVAVSNNLNSNTKKVEMVLPALTLSVDRIFPFAKQDGIKKGFIQNINFQYSLRGDNKIRTDEENLFTAKMFDNALAGFTHTIPLATNFKVFKYFSVTTSINYSENWVFNTINKQLVNNNGVPTVETITKNGFDSFRTYNAGASVGTTIYGTYTFKETGKLKSIRHVMTPNIGFGYTPSFNQYYTSYLDQTGQYVEYTRFEGSIAGAPGNQLSNSLSFGITNTLEAKVADPENKKDGVKKIKIFNALNLASGYNFAADKFKLQPINFNGGTQLFNQKLDLNFSSVLDPYATNDAGQRIDEFSISNGGPLVKMTQASITMSYSLTSAELEGKTKDKGNLKSQQNGGRNDDLFGKASNLTNQNESLFDKEEDTKKEETPTELYKFKIPWDLRFNYNLSYVNVNNKSEISSNAVNFSGNIDLAVRWKMGISSGYDFANKGITQTQLRFERDLESWRMSFSWVPIGPYQNWSFFIGIKSSILSDIKWEKQSLPDPRLR